jgi:hypothetical protein
MTRADWLMMGKKRKLEDNLSENGKVRRKLRMRGGGDGRDAEG